MIRQATSGLTGLALAVLALVGTLAGCTSRADSPPTAAAPPPPPPPVPVTATLAKRSDAPIELRAIGNVESKASVILHPQVTAMVSELLAPEGTDVAAGQALIKLDARPFQAAVREADANLARGRALAADARQVATRMGNASTSAAVSRVDMEQAEARAAAAEADAQAMQAQLDTARLRLEYCTISAPFAGRLGPYLVKPGAIVKSDEADLVQITQMNPVEVGFSVPEHHLSSVRTAADAGPLRVEAVPGRDSAGRRAVGTLTFMDSRIDMATGSLRLKATFDNAAGLLWPGQFVNVTLVIGRETDCILVPESAVQPSQAGPSVFVIKPDKTVELRPVGVRRTIDGNSIIERGLKEGENVVTDGQLRLAPGSTVEIKPSAAPKAG